MFENMLIVLLQVLTLFGLMTVGYILFKRKKIEDTAINSMTYLLMNIVTPCVIINALQVKKDDSMLGNMGITALISVFLYIVAITLSKFFFNKEDENIGIPMKFSIIYNNTGYMGFPLLAAVLGPQSLIYGAVAIAVFNLFLWSHGIIMMGSKEDISIKNALVNPGTIGLTAGLILFLTQYTLPSFIGNGVSMLADLNTPVAMVLLGCYMAKCDLKTTFTTKKYYLIALLKLIVVPAIIYGALMLLNLFLPQPLDNMVVAASVILSSAPTAVSSSLFANRYNRDTISTSQIITLVTILSIITMPIFAAIVKM